MRIAYVVLHLESKILKGGVGRKIFTHLRLWGEAGHQPRLFVLSPEDVEYEGVSVFPYLPGNHVFRPIKRFFLELERCRALARLIEQVKAYQPDVIYLRFGLFAFPLQRLFQVAPVVVELNTLDVEEYKYRGPFFYWLNRISRRYTLGHVSAMAAVTHEVALANRQFGKPIEVIANGVDYTQVLPLPAPANERPRLVLVGTPGYPWQGEDKVLSFAAQYPDLDFDIVGYGPQDISVDVPANVTLHGFLSPDAVRGVLAHADVAFGTLALHRKKMEEVNSLKVRESLGCGIPTIIACRDADLSGVKFDFVLEIPNTEDNLVTHAQAVRDFAYRMRGCRADRDVLAPRIEQHFKEAARLALFEKVFRARQ